MNLYLLPEWVPMLAALFAALSMMAWYRQSRDVTVFPVVLALVWLFSIYTLDYLDVIVDVERMVMIRGAIAILCGSIALRHLMLLCGKKLWPYLSRIGKHVKVGLWFNNK